MWTDEIVCKCSSYYSSRRDKIRTVYWCSASSRLVFMHMSLRTCQMQIIWFYLSLCKIFIHLFLCFVLLICYICYCCCCCFIHVHGYVTVVLLCYALQEFYCFYSKMNKINRIYWKAKKKIKVIYSHSNIYYNRCYIHTHRVRELCEPSKLMHNELDLAVSASTVRAILFDCGVVCRAPNFLDCFFFHAFFSLPLSLSLALLCAHSVVELFSCIISLLPTISQHNA